MTSARFLSILLFGCIPILADSRVWEATLALPSYDEGPPDLPPTVEFPYSMRNPALGARVRQTWRTLEMENEYLKCTVLPDLGGRVYSCIDKIAKRDLFYANPVIRRHRGGSRGVEIAAGDAFDFPLSPGPVEMSPVDYAIRQNADGSASIFIGNTGRDGTRWLVEMTLRPGSAVLEQHVTLSNPDRMRHSYTWWNRAAVRTFADTKLSMPCYLSSGAAGDVTPWTTYGTPNDAVERFAYRSQEGFLGVYSQSEGGGTAHYADPSIVAGKAVRYRGKETVKELSEDGSDFLELQAGLFPLKSGAGVLEPGQKVEFSEYWMPLRGLGGLSRVNPDAAVSLQRTPAGIALALNAYHAIPGAHLKVFEADRTLLEETVALAPEKTLSRSIPDPKPASKYHFELRDAQGKLLLEYTEDLYDALHAVPAAPAKPVNPAVTTDADLEAGRAAFTSSKYSNAIPLLQKAFSFPETRHYLGLANSYLGNDAQAQPLFARAPEDRLFGVPSQIELANLLGRQGDFKNALVHVQQALQTRPDLAGAGALEVALLRVTGRKPEARKRLDYWMQRDPADNALRCEGLKLGREDMRLWLHLAADPERLLAVANFYLWAGMYLDALDPLSFPFPKVDLLERDPGSPAPQEHPLVSYYRAYCLSKLKRPASEVKSEYQKASKLPAQFVVANRPESLIVLRAALTANPSDATARRLLGPVREAPPPMVARVAAPVSSPANPEERAAAALALVVRGQIAEAGAIFNAANFPKERQSETVREAFIEVRLQTILDLARRKRCSDMAGIVEGIGDESKDVPFSLYGFGPIVKTARVQYGLASAEQMCGDDKAAKKRFARIAKSAERAAGIEYAYGQLAAIKLGSPVGLAKPTQDAEGLYARGLLERANKQTAEAEASFHQALAQAGGNAILHYLCEMALAGR
jgi:tetratricopeptide (TPR) repeat protein